MPRPRVRRFRASKRKRALWENFRVDHRVGGDPVNYIDQDGRFIVAAIVVAALVGAYIGGATANGEYNPVDWDWSSGDTYGYMFTGAVIGGTTGAIGAAIAGGGYAGSITASTIFSSTFASSGFSTMAGGDGKPNTSFGVANYNWGTGEWGWLGKDGNSKMENVGYGLGLLGNVSDGLAMYDFAADTYTDPNAQGEVEVYTNNEDYISHSSAMTKNGEGVVSVGPEHPLHSKLETTLADPFHETKAGTDATWKDVVTHVNTDKFVKYSDDLQRAARQKQLIYNFYDKSCVNYVAAGLRTGGVNVVGVHPYLLKMQLMMRENYINFYGF